MIDRFRREVYQSFEQRADAGMDLIDALTGALTVESPVAQSESPLFRRRFSSVYDLLKRGRILLWQLRAERWTEIRQLAREYSLEEQRAPGILTV